MAHAIRVYGSISKVTKQDDGTLVVEGIASTESVDSQGEVVKADAMRAALPDFMKFANVREMHQPIAAGKAISCTVDDAGVTHISAHIVDSDSCKKVEAGVLQGFSIGGSVPPGGRDKDNAKIINTLKLSEISLVDRPANPDALITLFKMDSEPAAEPVAKGMYQVAWAAELCSALDALAASTGFEADAEGDGSLIPARLKALVAELCAVLRDLVAEETAELVGDDGAEVDVVGMASKPGALKKSEKLASIARAFISAAKGEQVEKKGAKFSKATAAALADIHKCVQDAHAKLGALGYDSAESEQKDDVSMAAQSGDVAKAADLEKRATEAEAATKLAGDALKKVCDERDALQKRLDVAEVELKKKGSLRAMPISKSDDAAQLAASATPIPGAVGEAASAAALTKAVHSSGGTRIL